MTAKLEPMDEAALNMIRNAGINDPLMLSEVKVLGNDLRAIADSDWPEREHDAETASMAVDVLRERIGGDRNLRSYLNTLAAGQRRQQRQSTK